MKSQIFVAIGVAIVTSVLVTGLASTIYAQSNMTGGGNMTGGNMSMPAGTTGDGGGDGDDGDGSGDGDGDGGDGDGSDGEDESN
jgi:hypothetical protein